MSIWYKNSECCKKAEDIIVWDIKKKEWVIFEDFYHEIYGIKYCPFCGKKLCLK